ncbi:MAG: dockerin type I repeat-containing protein [Prevotella sp.]|nr:dockerin type I repeat-containing protein [Prevotella sp.]
MNIKKICAAVSGLLLWGGCLTASATAPDDDDFNPTSPAEPAAISFCRISVSADPEEAAYVSGSGKYTLNGNEVYISTNANNTSDYTYTFKYWTVNGEKTPYSQSFYYTPTKGTFNFVAHYEKAEVVFDPENPAEPSSSSAKRKYYLYLKPSTEGGCSFNIDSGTKIKEGTGMYLNANINAGYTFEGWALNGTIISTDTYFYFTMPAAETTLEARVTEIPFDPESPIEPTGTTTNVDNATRQLMDLQIGNADGFADKTRIVINEAKTLDYDLGTDASKIISTEAAYQIYSLDNKNVQYAINERPKADGLIPLGIIVREPGEVTITATRLDRNMLLVDKLLDVELDLALGPYTFSSTVGTFNDRFCVKLPEKAVTGILGDANNDGIVNVADIVAIVGFLKSGVSDSLVKTQADANHDGFVTEDDIQSVSAIILPAATPM